MDDSLSDLQSAVRRIESKIDELKSLEAFDRIPTCLPGQRYGHLTYSQHGEDVVIVSLFEQLGIDKPSYLDIGAHHPLDCSNTALLYNRGSRGINVEANPELIDLFERQRPADVNVNAAVAATRGSALLFQPGERSGMATLSRELYETVVQNHPSHGGVPPIQVETVTINDLIGQYCDGVFPQFLTVDVEGLELDVLESADLSKSRPTVICVEYINSMSRDPGPLMQFLDAREYDFVIRMFANLIFIDRQAAKQMRPSSSTLSNL